MPIVSTHAVSSACCQPSASNSTISTSRRLRDGRATTAGAARRDGRARRAWRAWRDRCGVAKAMTPAVSSNCCSAAPCPSERRSLLRLMPPSAPRPSERSAPLPMLALGGVPSSHRSTRDRWHEPCPALAGCGAAPGGQKTRGRYAPAESMRARGGRSDKKGSQEKGKRWEMPASVLEHPHHQNRRRVDGQHCKAVFIVWTLNCVATTKTQSRQ